MLGLREQVDISHSKLYVAHCVLAHVSQMARQGPVKVAQRHRSERYPENPRRSSAERSAPTPRRVPNTGNTMRLTSASSRHTGLVYQYDHHHKRHSRQN